MQSGVSGRPNPELGRLGVGFSDMHKNRYGVLVLRWVGTCRYRLMVTALRVTQSSATALVNGKW